ncbi:unnamed protein product [Rhizophagus irregularis]|nr:unnamed protein product [Rhizophagus irregularis]
MQITRTLRKGPWTLDEERRLVILVNQFGAVGSWQQISSLLGSRNAHQCRKRYRHLVRANTIRRPFPPIPQNYAHPTSLAPRNSRLETSYYEIKKIYHHDMFVMY